MTFVMSKYIREIADKDTTPTTNNR